MPLGDIPRFLAAVDIVEAKTVLELENVDNTADIDKPVSTAQAAADAVVAANAAAALAAHKAAGGSEHPAVTPSVNGFMTAADKTFLNSIVANIRTFLATPTSANLAAAVTDKTGTAGSLVFSVSPTFTGTINAATLSLSETILGVAGTFSGDVSVVNVLCSGYTKTGIVAVASLPVASGVPGARMAVNNATQALTAGIGAIVAGGGTNTVPVFSDGANWRIG